MVQGGIDALRQIIREKEPLRPSTKLNTLPGEARTTAGKRRQTDVGKLVHQLQGDLDWIVMKCLEKDRTRRYDTANGLASDIQRHLDNETVLARPPSAAYRFQKLVRRNKLAFAAVGAVACALVLGVVVSTWQAVRATRAEQAQKAQADQARADRDRAVLAEGDARIQTGVAKDALATVRRKAYAAEVNVAFQALAENNLARAIDLLNRQRPKPEEEDLRGFEWRLLWQQCQSDQKVTFRDEGAGGEVHFSPDGKWLVHAGDEIVISELPSLAKVATIPSGARTFAFSPRARLLAVSQDTEVRLWSTESWKEERTLPGTRYPAVFSPDGQWLVTGVPGGYRLWNTETWESERFLGSELSSVWVARRGVAFSPDGALLVTAGHPDGRESGNQFQVWDFPSFTVRSNFARFPGRLGCAAFAPDGKHLLTGTGEGALLVWNVAEGRIVESANEHTSFITTIAFGRDGRTFATASTDRTLVLWDATTRKALVRLRGHLAQVWSVAMSPDGRMVASGALDGTTRLWDAATRHKQRELPECFLVAGFSSDSRRLVGVGYGESRLWNLENGAISIIPLQDYKKLHYRDDYRFMWASKDVHGMEPKAVYGRTDGVLEVWNLAMSQVTSWRVDDGEVATAAFSPDGQFIATGGAKGEVVLWDAGTRREVRRFESLGVKLMCLTFSPDGRLLAGSEEKNVESSHVGIWDVNTGAVMRKLTIPYDVVLSLAFSPDGKLLATAEQNETVRLWDIPSGALRVTLLGHAQTVVSVAFSPDGKTLATCASDSKVKLWNIATEQEVATLELPGGCSSVKFSPDGRTLAVGYLLEPEQLIRLWEVPSFEDIEAAEAKEKTASKQP
jgi:WD40 repeat protein